jgi:Transcription factor zinc-finger
VSEQTATAWPCPKDATTMQPMGRRSGAWRCPVCRGIFIDTEAMRRGRRSGPAKVSPVVTSVLLSLLVTFVVRRLRRRTPTATASQPEIGQVGG